ncbi:conjugal transfer protein TraH [Geothermobacter hydrogeniphilus]|uniref:Conjugative transfer pilus assembly protein TraH n=1 Tax=Geothermobacter hydrogeniphilus TaxID=1969733 RepID=A0A1X0Y7Y2_9BACT|nr:conjugal transfer protein TraH [Geothermobacter hydrogeniphilus]ORJ61310.1 hypothetical protein B5V00_06675 [Geothermobacter hydrogeniphilus]
MNQRACIRVVLVAVLVLTGLTSAHAGWVDDWVNQKTESSPGSYQGQTRNYYTAGSFSARWNTRSDYLWSMSPPKLKTGCGGIDAFMGGMTFLNTDYLVEKLERIMNAAPAAAFDVALKVLAPQVSDTIRSMENMASKLNNIQLDECRASKALVATIANPLVSNPDKKKELGAIQTDWWQSTGVGDLWTEFQKQRKADNDNPDPAAAAGSMSGCSAEFRDVFAGGSVLQNVAAKVGMTNLDYLDLIRGYVGDVYIEAPNAATGFGAYKVVGDDPCEKNTGLDDFINGDAEGRPTGGACAPITDANRNLQVYVQNMIQAINTRYTSRQPLTSTETDFMNAMPLPVSLILKNARSAGMVQAEVSYLGNVAGKAYSYRLLADLFARTSKLLYTAQTIMATQNNPTGSNATATCRIENVQEASNRIAAMMDRTGKLYAAVRSDYAAALSEINALETYVKRRQEFSRNVRDELAARFGERLADRATKPNG